MTSPKTRTKCRNGHPFLEGSYREAADGRRICLICNPSTTCAVEDCDKLVHAQAYCQRHYRLFKKYGVPENKPKEQYETPGPKPRSGGPTSRCSHGHEFTTENTGYLPSGRRVCKTCSQDNEKTHCPQGHPFDAENTYVDNGGYKQCKACRRERMAKRRASIPSPSTPTVTCSQGHVYPEDATLDEAGRRVCAECVKAREERRRKRQEERSHCANGHELVDGSWFRDNLGNQVCITCRKETEARSRKKRYGLTDEEYQDLEEKQGHKCAICHRPFEGMKKKPSIDHFHDCCPKGKSCGKCVRGLLCHRCNTALGMLGDSPALLLEAAQYLMDAEKFRAQSE